MEGLEHRVRETMEQYHMLERATGLLQQFQEGQIPSAS